VRVLVTGATGFVGCHTAAALANRGHDVRLFVRNPQKIARALGPLGLAECDYAEGDVTDAAAVRSALEGCEAVVHAAAVFTLDRRRDEEMMHVNVRGTEIVMEAAIAAAIDPIVYVSSVSALFPPDADTVGPEERVKSPQDAYARSKADAERIVRDLQAAGHPITTIYPGAVWGPCDPTFSDGIRVIMGFVKRGVIPVTPGGMPVIDARDVAAVHAAALEPGRGPRRFMLGGTFLNNAALADTISDLTGRRMWKAPAPGPLVRAYGRLGDAVRRTTGVDLGLTYEAALTLTRGVPCDDSRTEAELGVRRRSVTETLADTLVWLHREGVLTRREVGRLVD